MSDPRFIHLGRTPFSGCEVVSRHRSTGGNLLAIGVEIT